MRTQTLEYHVMTSISVRSQATRRGAVSATRPSSPEGGAPHLRVAGLKRLVAFGIAVALTALSTRDAAATLTAYPRVGSQTDSAAAPQGPGLIVMGGGTDVDSAFVWMHDTVVGSAAGAGGDVVVLRATGANAYDAYIAGLARFNSVQTLLIAAPVSAADLATGAGIVNKAEAVFFAGGNQADYVAWRNTALMTSVVQVFQRGGVVGGTSAGAAILGQYIFDAVANGTGPNVAGPDAVANPYEPIISFTRDMLPFAVLKGAITDTHFVERDRFDRLSVFMGRQLADGFASGQVHGIGVDAKTAIVIGKNGIGTLKQFTPGTGTAFVITGGMPATIQSGKPLVYPMLSVTRLDRDGQTYDFARWCGSTSTYSVSVDGSKTPTDQPASPYTASGSLGTCDAPGGGGDMGSGAGGGGGGPGAGSPDMGAPGEGNFNYGCQLGAPGVPPSIAWLTLAIGVALAFRRRRS